VSIVYVLEPLLSHPFSYPVMCETVEKTNPLRLFYRRPEIMKMETGFDACYYRLRDLWYLVEEFQKKKIIINKG
jgi:hypothetical protein